MKKARGNNKKKSNASRVGIRDWNLKKLVLRSLVGASSDKGLVDSMSLRFKLNDDEDRREVVEKLYDTFRRWNSSRPKAGRSVEFWDCVIADQKLTVRTSKLWSVGIIEFIGLFRDDEYRRDAVTEILENSQEVDVELARILREKYLREEDPEKDDTSNDAKGYYEIFSNENLIYEGPNTGFSDGHVRVDQFYNCPESAKAWADLIDASMYQMYLDCLVSLRNMTTSDLWVQYLTETTSPVVVALGGGGSPEKDWVIMESVARNLRDNQELTYVVTDISPFMIHQTAKHLGRLISRSDFGTRVKTKYGYADFLKLQRTFARPNGGRQVTWALLGGTIGNVNELQFFQSINGPSKAGDLLLIGIDTLQPEETVAEFEDRMLQQYSTTETQSLLLAPMYRGNSEIVGNAKLQLRFPKSTEEHKFTSVHGSRTIAFFLDDCRVASSTRYILDEFLKFSCDLGWECLRVEKPGEDSTYRQLLMRRKRD